MKTTQITLSAAGGNLIDTQTPIYIQFDSNVFTTDEEGTTPVSPKAEQRGYEFGGWQVSGANVIVTDKEGALVTGTIADFVTNGKWTYGGSYHVAGQTDAIEAAALEFVATYTALDITINASVSESGGRIVEVPDDGTWTVSADKAIATKSIQFNEKLGELPRVSLSR